MVITVPVHFATFGLHLLLHIFYSPIKSTVDFLALKARSLIVKKCGLEKRGI